MSLTGCGLPTAPFFQTFYGKITPIVGHHSIPKVNSYMTINASHTSVSTAAHNGSRRNIFHAGIAGIFIVVPHIDGVPIRDCWCSCSLINSRHPLSAHIRSTRVNSLIISGMIHDALHQWRHRSIVVSPSAFLVLFISHVIEPIEVIIVHVLHTFFHIRTIRCPPCRTDSIHKSPGGFFGILLVIVVPIRGNFPYIRFSV